MSLVVVAYVAMITVAGWDEKPHWKLLAVCGLGALACALLLRAGRAALRSDG
jgi:hypothetical protein